MFKYSIFQTCLNVWSSFRGFKFTERLMTVINGLVFEYCLLWPNNLHVKYHQTSSTSFIIGFWGNQGNGFIFIDFSYGFLGFKICSCALSCYFNHPYSPKLAVAVSINDSKQLITLIVQCRIDSLKHMHAVADKWNVLQ